MCIGEHKFFCSENFGEHKFFCSENFGEHKFFSSENFGEHKFFSSENFGEQKFFCSENFGEHKFFVHKTYALWTKQPVPGLTHLCPGGHMCPLSLKFQFYFKKGSSKKFPMSVAPMSR